MFERAPVALAVRMELTLNTWRRKRDRVFVVGQETMRTSSLSRLISIPFVSARVADPRSEKSHCSEAGIHHANRPKPYQRRGDAETGEYVRWSRFLRQGPKVDLPMKRMIEHEDTQTVYGRVQGQGRSLRRSAASGRFRNWRRSASFTPTRSRSGNGRPLRTWPRRSTTGLRMHRSAGRPR